MIKPMPLKYGVGFTSTEPLPDDLVDGYRCEQIGRNYNYHVTAKKWGWPIKYEPASRPATIDDLKKVTIDAFSPNLNKELHVGHLRNLVIANSLKRTLPDTKFVAMLGCSLGVKEVALAGLNRWFDFLNYRPEIFYDCALPDDVVPCRDPTVKEIEDGVIDVNEGDDLTLPKLWDGPNGPVIVKRSDGRPTYAYHDLALAHMISPDYYITGEEQQEHFANLGFADKHLSMGLVLGTDGKKMKSREGEVMLAAVAANMTRDELRDTEDPDKLAWNILAWNFLHTARKSNLKFEVEKWVKPESPGMYITYTYARIKKAMPDVFIGYWRDSTWVNQPTLEDVDLRLLGVAETYPYYYHRACDNMDPSPIANFTHDLARQIGVAYESEPIKDGRPAFKGALAHAMWRLEMCLDNLGMWALNAV